MDERELKTFLEGVRRARFQMPDEQQPIALARELLAHIGTADADLRERLIYAALGVWIEVQRIFTADELRELLRTALDDAHLFRGIGETAGDAVFTRSYSALVVARVLTVHHEAPFLNRDDINTVQGALLRYLAAERDQRGWVGDKGRAHGRAHAAEALSELARCPEVHAGDLHTIINAVRLAVTSSAQAVDHAEEERFVDVIAAAVERGRISEDHWAMWVDGFLPLVEEADPPCYGCALNTKRFLQSLFFRAALSGWKDFPLDVVAEKAAIILDERLY